MSDSNGTGTPQPEDETELRKWAIEIAVRAAPDWLAIIPFAEDVLRFVRPVAEASVTALKINEPTERWSTERHEMAVAMREIGNGCSLIAVAMNKLPGRKLTRAYVNVKLRSFGIRPPDTPAQRERQAHSVKIRAIRLANAAARGATP